MLQEDYRLGGKLRLLWKESGSLMLVPDEVKKSVVFVGYKDSDNNFKLAGTAFFIGVPLTNKPENSFIYLITAKHIIEGIKTKSKDQKVYLRFNVKNDGTILMPVPIDKWLFHPQDESVDGAVLPISGGPQLEGGQQLDFLLLPNNIAVTQEIVEKEGIGIGDEVFIVGLFAKHYGVEKNLPIIRVGNIALMSEEKINTEKYGLIDGYLIECRSIGGLSGSPVIVHLAGVRLIKGQKNYQILGDRFFWLGLIHGHWDVPISDTLVEDAFTHEKVNMGITIVIPAKKILEIINQEELVAKRKQQEEKLLKERMPTLDISEEEFKGSLKKVSRKIVPPGKERS